MPNEIYQELMELHLKFDGIFALLTPGPDPAAIDNQLRCRINSDSYRGGMTSENK